MCKNKKMNFSFLSDSPKSPSDFAESNLLLFVGWIQWWRSQDLVVSRDPILVLYKPFPSGKMSINKTSFLVLWLQSQSFNSSIIIWTHYTGSVHFWASQSSGCKYWESKSTGAQWIECILTILFSVYRQQPCPGIIIVVPAERVREGTMTWASYVCVENVCG